MTDTYVGSPVFPTSLTVPKDGEAATVASILVAIEGNRDAVVYLKRITDTVDGEPIRTLRTPALKDTLGASLAFLHTRGDGTSTAFYSLTASLWVKCGVNTAGKIVVGDFETWQVYDTGAAGAVKVSFGCDSATAAAPGRIALFNGDRKTSGGGVDPKYILDPASGDITGTWTTRSLDTIGSFVTYVQAYDCVVTPTQRVIVAGGGDLSGAGQFLIWKSDDFGFTFTRVTVGNVSASLDALTRIIVGKNGRLVAWIKTSAANQGNKLFYSDDNGNTWSSRSAIGFDNIVDGVYLADLDVWAFSSNATIYTTPDPVLGAFTAHAVGTTPTAMGGFGHYLMWARHTSAVRDELLLSVDALAAAATQFVGRSPTLSGASYVHVAVSPYGQLLMSTNDSLTLTDRV